MKKIKMVFDQFSSLVVITVIGILIPVFGISITSPNGPSINALYGSSFNLTFTIHANKSVTLLAHFIKAYNSSSKTYVDYKKPDVLTEISTFSKISPSTKRITIPIKKLDYAEPYQHMRIDAEEVESSGLSTTISFNFKINILDTIRDCGNSNLNLYKPIPGGSLQIQEFKSIRVYHTICGQPTPKISVSFPGYSVPESQYTFKQKQILNTAERDGFQYFYNTTRFDMVIKNVTRRMCGRRISFRMSGGAKNKTVIINTMKLQVDFTSPIVHNVRVKLTTYNYLVIQWDVQNTGACVVNFYTVSIQYDSISTLFRDFNTTTKHGNVHLISENAKNVTSLSLWTTYNNKRSPAFKVDTIPYPGSKVKSTAVPPTNTTSTGDDGEDKMTFWKILAFIFIGLFALSFFCLVLYFCRCCCTKKNNTKLTKGVEVTELSEPRQSNELYEVPDHDQQIRADYTQVTESQQQEISPYDQYNTIATNSDSSDNSHLSPQNDITADRSSFSKSPLISSTPPPPPRPITPNPTGQQCYDNVQNTVPVNNNHENRGFEQDDGYEPMGGRRTSFNPPPTQKEIVSTESFYEVPNDQA